MVSRHFDLLATPMLLACLAKPSRVPMVVIEGGVAEPVEGACPREDVVGDGGLHVHRTLGGRADGARWRSRRDGWRGGWSEDRSKAVRGLRLLSSDSLTAAATALWPVAAAPPLTAATGGTGAQCGGGMARSADSGIAEGAGVMAPARVGVCGAGFRRDWLGRKLRPKTAGSKWATTRRTEATEAGAPTPRRANFPGGGSAPRVGVACAMANLFLPAAAAACKRRTVRTGDEGGGSDVGASDDAAGRRRR